MRVLASFMAWPNLVSSILWRLSILRICSMASIPPSPSPASAEPMLCPQGDYAGKPPLRLQKSVVVVVAPTSIAISI